MPSPFPRFLLCPPLLHRGIKQHGNPGSLENINADAQARMWDAYAICYHHYTQTSFAERAQCLQALQRLNDRLNKGANLPTTHRHFMYITACINTLHNYNHFTTLTEAIERCHAVLERTQAYVTCGEAYSHAIHPKTQQKIAKANLVANTNDTVESLIEYDRALLSQHTEAELKTFLKQRAPANQPLVQLVQYRQAGQRIGLSPNLIQQFDDDIKRYHRDPVALRACLQQHQARCALPLLLLHCAKDLRHLRNTDKLRIYFQLLAEPNKTIWNSKADYFRQLPLTITDAYLKHLNDKIKQSADAGPVAIAGSDQLGKLLITLSTVFRCIRPTEKRDQTRAQLSVAKSVLRWG